MNGLAVGVGGTPWEADGQGVLTLPTGRRVRGRALRREVAPDAVPDLGIYLVRQPPPEFDWDSQWVKWPDFGLPASQAQAIETLTAAWLASADRRVEVACTGGIGRTGTALALLVVIDGLPAADAISYVREHYHPRAVETPWQRRFVLRAPRMLR